MTRLKVATLCLVIAIVGLAAVPIPGEIPIALMRRTAAKSIFSDALSILPDGLHVAFCGTGSPLPSPSRAGPCTAVIAGRRLFIVDVGRGAADVIARMGLQAGRIEAVLLTHFHSDHIDGLAQLAEQRWLAWGATTPLPVWGPAGLEHVVSGFNEAHQPNRSFRISHHGTSIAAPSGFGLAARPFAIEDGNDISAVVLEDGGVRITAFTVNHQPVHPAVGYRFDYAGRSVVVSGDTAKSSNLVAVATGADLLVHEAMSPRLVAALEQSATAAGRNAAAQLFRDLQSFHTSPEQAADEAKQARVHALVLTHFIPPVPMGLLERPFLGDARTRYPGPLLLARDGDLISLPARTRGLKSENLLE